MEEFIINIMNSYGYIGVFTLILIENIFPPIPSEIILLFSGFMTTYTNLKLSMMIISSSLASVIGALILYKLGNILNIDKIISIVNKKKILNLREKDITASIEWFKTKGEKAIFICRFIPLLRSLISVPAGIYKMNIIKFIIYTALGSVLWNTILISLGYITSNNWTSILNIYSLYTLLILIIILSFLVIKFHKKKG